MWIVSLPYQPFRCQSCTINSLVQDCSNSMANTLKLLQSCAKLLIYGTQPGSSMMTSSNGNNFRVAGHLCGEFTGHQWIPLTKASDAEFEVFCVWINETLLHSLWCYCNVLCLLMLGHQLAQFWLWWMMKHSNMNESCESTVRLYRTIATWYI